MIKKWICFVLLSLLASPFYFLAAQTDTIPLSQRSDNENTDLIEDFILNSGLEGDFDYNTLFEHLEYLQEHPLNVNLAGREELEDLNLLTAIQVNDLLQYRKEFGDLIALEELQSITSFDLNTIQRILPFLQISGGLDDYNVPIPTMLSSGKNELYLRWRRVLETQKGYKTKADGSPASFLGDPNKLYMRYKHSFENRLSYGFTAEKDEGEEFFKGSNQQGFDFYSAHIALKNASKLVKDLVIGDFNASFGQGLILFSGFSNGKGAEVMDIKRGARAVRAYTSVNEFNYMRGAAATLGLTDHIELTTFVSYRKRDANLGATDTTDLDNDILFFTSLQSSGLHRTLGEIEDEASIKQFVTGGSVKYKTDTWHVAVNGLYNKLDRDLVRNPLPYNQFYFSGNQLLNTSIDYSFLYQNFNFFGETAISDNGKIATTNGVLIGLDRDMDLAILYRKFAKDYQALDSNPFQESSGGRNESGLYLGLEIRPSNHWKIKTYFDIYQHPWLRSAADAPSKGNDFRTRIIYFQKRKFEAFLELRREQKELNAPISTEVSKTDILVKYSLSQARLFFSNKVSKSLELRSNIGYGVFNDGVNKKSSGIVLYQDIIYKPMTFPLHFTTRFAIYDTGGSQIRYYAYENNLLYVYGIPAYYNKGTRFYINLRYKGIRNLTLEARYAQTYWSNKDTFSSGFSEIDGPSRSELSAQIKYQF